MSDGKRNDNMLLLVLARTCEYAYYGIDASRTRVIDGQRTGGASYFSGVFSSGIPPKYPLFAGFKIWRRFFSWGCYVLLRSRVDLP